MQCYNISHLLKTQIVLICQNLEEEFFQMVCYSLLGQSKHHKYSEYFRQFSVCDIYFSLYCIFLVVS